MTSPSTALLEDWTLRLMAYTAAQYGRLDTPANLLGVPSDRSRSSEVDRKRHQENGGGASQGEDQANSPLDDDTLET